MEFFIRRITPEQIGIMRSLIETGLKEAKEKGEIEGDDLWAIERIINACDFVAVEKKVSEIHTVDLILKRYGETDAGSVGIFNHPTVYRPNKREG